MFAVQMHAVPWVWPHSKIMYCSHQKLKSPFHHRNFSRDNFYVPWKVWNSSTIGFDCIETRRHSWCPADKCYRLWWLPDRSSNAIFVNAELYFVHTTMVNISNMVEQQPAQAAPQQFDTLKSAWPPCLVFWCPAKSEWCTGERREVLRIDVSEPHLFLQQTADTLLIFSNNLFNWSFGIDSFTMFVLSNQESTCQNYIYIKKF